MDLNGWSPCLLEPLRYRDYKGTPQRLQEDITSYFNRVSLPRTSTDMKP